MTDVAKIDLPYIQRFKDRHGRERAYYRRKGFKKVALPTVGSPGFLAAYEAANTPDRSQGVASERSKPGTLSALLAAYFLSGTFRDLRASTQRSQRNQLDRFRKDYGVCLVKDFTRELLDEIFEGMESRAQAMNLRKRLRRVFRFGIKLGWMGENPIRDTEAPKYRTKGFTPWSEEDIAAFEKRWPSGTRERLALALLLYTGQRRSDVVTIGRQHVKAGRIHVQQLKTDARVAIRMHPLLRAEIDAAPNEMTFLLTGYGKPFSAAGFTSWFVERAEAAGLNGRTPHGLRKAAGRRLAEAGCSSKEIAAVLGHQTLAEIERYTKDADIERLSDTAMDKLENGS
jgi:integrase